MRTDSRLSSQLLFSAELRVLCSCSAHGRRFPACVAQPVRPVRYPTPAALLPVIILAFTQTAALLHLKITSTSRPLERCLPRRCNRPGTKAEPFAPHFRQLRSALVPRSRGTPEPAVTTRAKHRPTRRFTPRPRPVADHWRSSLTGNPAIRKRAHQTRASNETKNVPLRYMTFPVPQARYAMFRSRSRLLALIRHRRLAARW